MFIHKQDGGWPFHNKSEQGIWQGQGNFVGGEFRNSCSAWSGEAFCNSSRGWYIAPVQWYNSPVVCAPEIVQTSNSPSGQCGINIQLAEVWEQGKHGDSSMARLRERQSSRRGSGRGSSSRRPAEEQHHHCCCCYCHRRAKATPLQTRQFLEVGSASAGEKGLPAFGSVIFTLGGTEEHAGINAHISILFTKLPDDAEVTVAPPPMPPAEEEGDAAAAQPLLEDDGKGKEPLQHPSPSLGPAPPGFTEETWKALWEGVEEGHGWAHVVEDKSLCEEAEAHLADHRPPSSRSQD